MPKSVAPPIKPTASPAASGLTAKDAINAMYSGDSPSGLGQYLGATAPKTVTKTVPKAASRTAPKTVPKTAASSTAKASKPSASKPQVQIRSRDRLESARPSASSIIRRAGEETAQVSIVRTSLKLKPAPKPQVATPADAVSIIRSAATGAIAASPTKSQTKITPKAPRVSTIVTPAKSQTKITPRTLAPSTPLAAATTVAAASSSKSQTKITPKTLTTNPRISADPPKRLFALKPPKIILPTSVRGTKNTKAPVAAVSNPAAPSPTTVKSAAPSPATPKLAISKTITSGSVSQPTPRPAPRPTSQTAPRPAPRPAPKRRRPFDSLKNRFRLAPKGYASTEDQQPRAVPNASFQNPNHPIDSAPRPARVFADISAPKARSQQLTEVAPPSAAQHAITNPTAQFTAHSAASTRPAPRLATDVQSAVASRLATTTKSAAHNAQSAQTAPLSTHGSFHLYGLSDHPESFSPTPDWARPYADAQQHADGLGIIEDYHPDGQPNISSAQSHTLSQSSFISPDNNRYALSGQSPYFIKNAKGLDKRPLAAPGSKYQIPTAGVKSSPIAPLSRKNSYNKRPAPSNTTKTAKIKPDPSPRDVVARPTIVVPDSHRSRTPMFILLIITVLLGAAVGALAYLFFFQGK